MSTHGYNPVILINVLTRTQSTQLHSRGLSTPLPQGAILLAININQKLVTINAKSIGTIHTAALLWYLTMSQLGHNPRGFLLNIIPLPLVVISLAININQKLLIMNAKSKRHYPQPV